MTNSNRDFESTVAKIYQVLSVSVEVIVLFLRVIFYTIYGIYQLIIPPKEKNVAGELVLITGTGHGIGKELAKQYGELGAEVICVDVNSQTNEATVKELKKLGIRAHAYSCDVRNRENVLSLGKKIQEEVGDVTILVNNAGIMPCKKFLSHSSEEIKKIFDVNIFAHFWMLEAFLPAMIKNNKGHVVATSSVAGLVGSPHVVPYCASKFAVRGLMEGLSEEFREYDQPNINFTTVFPYMTDTGLCQKPKIKFSNFMKMLSPAETASIIIRAQRLNIKEATAPQFMLYVNHITRLFPWTCASLVVDFFGSKLEALN